MDTSNIRELAAEEIDHVAGGSFGGGVSPAVLGSGPANYVNFVGLLLVGWVFI